MTVLLDNILSIHQTMGYLHCPACGTTHRSLESFTCPVCELDVVVSDDRVQVILPKYWGVKSQEMMYRMLRAMYFVENQLQKIVEGEDV